MFEEGTEIQKVNNVMSTKAGGMSTKTGNNYVKLN